MYMYVHRYITIARIILPLLKNQLPLKIKFNKFTESLHEIKKFNMMLFLSIPGLQSSSTKHGSSSVSRPLGQVLLRVFVLSLHFSPAHSLHVDHGSHIGVDVAKISNTIT